MGNNKHEKKFVDYWTFKNAYDLLIGLIKNAVPEPLKIDSINEKTIDTGVTVDGVLLKDGYVDPLSINPITYYNIEATGTTSLGSQLLKYGFNQVTVASSNNRCVSLPEEITNQKLYINNYTSEVITVYGNKAGQLILQNVTNNTPTTFDNIDLQPGKTVEFVRIGSIWLAVSFNGVANKPLVYKAILTQSGTNAPVATVLNSGDANYLGDLTWLRISAGLYYCDLTGASISNTLVNFNFIGGSPTQNMYCISGQSGNQKINISSYNNGIAYDGFQYLSITIEYYGS